MQTSHPDRDPVREDQMVGLLEALHAIRSPELEQILEEVAAHVAATFRADLADIFVYAADVTSLVALGTSPTPLGRRRRALGLDRLPLVNGGRAVATFRSGVPHLTGRADADPEELPGFVVGLGVRSVATCAIQVGGERRGVLAVAAIRPDAFRERDLRALGVVANWVGLVMERAELVQRLAAAAERRGYERAGHELARLTTRQRAVAALVADGRTNGEIATCLGLTEGTVANHMEQAMRRLELRSRAQLAVWAYRHGLYRPDDDPDEPAAPADADHQEVNAPEPSPLDHEDVARQQQERDAEPHLVHGRRQRPPTDMADAAGPRPHAGVHRGHRSSASPSSRRPIWHQWSR